jgi:fimbrial chaperone protein
MKAARAVLVLACTVLAAAGAAAFTMEPMSTLLAPAGAGSIGTFRIKNEGDFRIAVTFKALTRAVDAAGVETNAPADDLFNIYPARLVVEPGTVAAVKVQWRGPAKLDVERSFRFVAEEVALDAGAAGQASAIRVLFRYVAALYVGEAGFAPRLVAVAVPAIGPGGESGFRLEIRNQGGRHVIALDPAVEISGAAGVKIIVPAAELGDLAGANFLAGSLRSRFIPRAEAAAGQSYAAKILYTAAY